MGYQKPNRTVTITFEDTDFEGAEVKATRNVTFAQILALDDMEELDKFKDEVDAFIKGMVVEWNLENADGTPTPLSGEALLTNWPIDFVTLLIKTWREVLFSPPAPLESESPNGLLEEELSLAEFSMPS